MRTPIDIEWQVAKGGNTQYHVAMLHHRPQSPMPSSPSTRTRTTTSSKKKIEVAFLIFITLVAANFVALLVHVWYFLPDQNNDMLMLHPTNNNKGSITTSLRTSFKKRVRRYGFWHWFFGFGFDADDGAASKALQQALSLDSIVRYDVVPKILDHDSSNYGVVHQLPSIPKRRRMIPDANNDFNFTIPPNAVHNLTYFLESRIRADEEDRPLFIYNPMVLPLNDKVIDDKILSDLSLSRSNDVDDALMPSYVAAYRISNFGNCHGPGRGVPDTYQNYLGLALLDRDLNIMQHPTNGEYLDVVIDLNRHLYDVRWSPDGVAGRRLTKPKQYMQDCQLFAAQSPSSSNDTDIERKANHLILFCNEYAMPVRLQIRKSGDHLPRNTATNGKNSNEGSGEHGENEMFNFRNTYGSGLQLAALRMPNVILYAAKNMHYIPPMVAAQGPTSSGFLEIWPSGPHEVLPVDFGTYPYVNRRSPRHGANKVLKSEKPEPDASFVTIDSVNNQKNGGGSSSSPLIDRDSGSACCVSILWKDGENHGAGRRLLLGFSHRKTRIKAGKYNYVSRVYAFEPTPPFDIVARSGFFCLGFAPTSSHDHGSGNSPSLQMGGDEALESDNEQIWGATREYKLKIKNEEFNCPRIHFVTGIAEKMGDEEMVIVSYGVNDCYPRMVEVSKDFLVSLLKG